MALRNNIICNVILEAARNNVFADSSDDEEEILEKVSNFAEITVPHMSDKQFKTHLRMSADTFEDMLTKLHSVQRANGERWHRTFPKTIIINNNNSILVSKF